MGGSMKVTSVFGLVAGLLFAFPHTCIGAEADFTNGKAQLKVKFSNSHIIDVEISTSIVGPTLPFAGSFEWGGDEVFHPKDFISSFKVNVDNEVVPVPLSAFIDLGNPYKISIQETDKGFEVTIIGGDAAVGYRSIYSFEKLDGDIFLRRRKVVHLEFPEESWEETTYSSPLKTD